MTCNVVGAVSTVFTREPKFCQLVVYRLMKWETKTLEQIIQDTKGEYRLCSATTFQTSVTHQSTGRTRGDGAVQISPIDLAFPTLSVSQ